MTMMVMMPSFCVFFIRFAYQLLQWYEGGVLVIIQGLVVKQRQKGSHKFRPVQTKYETANPLTCWVLEVLVSKGNGG